MAVEVDFLRTASVLRESFGRNLLSRKPETSKPRPLAAGLGLFHEKLQAWSEDPLILAIRGLKSGHKLPKLKASQKSLKRGSCQAGSPVRWRLLPCFSR